MALVLPDLDLWRARLEAEAKPPLALVRTVASATAVVASNTARFPAAMIFPISDTPAPPQDVLSTEVVTMTVGVAVLVQDLRSMLSGSGGIERYRECRQAIIGALHAWRPEDALDVITYSGGSLADFGEGIQVFIDNFDLTWLLRI